MKIENGEIIAGKSVGNINLGDTFGELLKHIGDDYTVKDRFESKEIMVENAHFWIDKQDIIEQIMVFGDFKGKFLNYIGIGSTLEDVEKYIGEWREERDVYIIPSRKGICFELYDDPNDDLIRSIYTY